MNIPMYDLCTLDGYYLVQAIRARVKKEKQLPLWHRAMNWICDVLGFVDG